MPSKKSIRKKSTKSKKTSSGKTHRLHNKKESNKRETIKSKKKDNSSDKETSEELEKSEGSVEEQHSVSKTKQKKDDNQKINYEPIIYEIPKEKEPIFKNDVSPIYSSSYAFPRLDLGFHYYIHTAKSKMELTTQIKFNKNIYNVVLPFETEISENINSSNVSSKTEKSETDENNKIENSINQYSRKFFAKKPEILSRGFFKLWEILNMFDLIPLNASKFSSAHLAEAPGGFAQATVYFRELYSTVSDDKRSDKFYGISMTTTDKKHKHSNKKIDTEFTKYYSENNKKQKASKFITYKACDEEVAAGVKGDLTNPVCIKNFTDKFKSNKVMFVTADGGFDWQNENIQEQEAIKLILGQICTAIKIQDDKGNMIIKFFEIFTGVSLKLIALLASCYNKVYIVKPLTSRESNSERYIICIGFHLSEKETKKIFSDLLSVIEESDKKNSQIIDIYPDYQIPIKLKGTLCAINTEISNRQIVVINKIIAYIKTNNQYGNLYSLYKENQIKANNYWVNLFFNSDHGHTTRMTQLILKYILPKTINNAEKFISIFKKSE